MDRSEPRQRHGARHGGQTSASFRMPPRRDPEAECAVLGSVLLDNAILAEVETLLAHDDLYEPRNAEIYEAMLALSQRRKPIDVVTRSAELRSRESLNTIGGTRYFGEFTDSIPTTAYIESHARIVADTPRVRRVLNARQGLELFGAELRALPERLEEPPAREPAPVLMPAPVNTQSCPTRAASDRRSATEASSGGGDAARGEALDHLERGRRECAHESAALHWHDATGCIPTSMRDRFRRGATRGVSLLSMGRIRLRALTAHDAARRSWRTVTRAQVALQIGACRRNGTAAR